jgi:hypothetical protein
MAASKSPPFSGWFPAETHARERAMVMACPEPTQPKRAEHPSRAVKRAKPPGSATEHVRARGVSGTPSRSRPSNQPTTSPAGGPGSRKRRRAHRHAGPGQKVKGSSRLSATHPCSRTRRGEGPHDRHRHRQRLDPRDLLPLASEV